MVNKSDTTVDQHKKSESGVNSHYCRHESTPSIKIPLKRSTSRYILNRFTVISIPKEPSVNHFIKVWYVRFFS